MDQRTLQRPMTFQRNPALLNYWSVEIPGTQAVCAQDLPSEIPPSSQLAGFIHRPSFEHLTNFDQHVMNIICLERIPLDFVYDDSR